MKKIILILVVAVIAKSQSVSPFNAPPFASAPSICNIGDLYRNTTSTPNILYQCTSGNVWLPLIQGPQFGSINLQVPRWTGATGGILNGGIGVTQNNGSSGLVQTLGTEIDPSLVSTTSLQVTNDTITGTSVFHLAKINSAGHAINALTTDTAVPVFPCISGCSTSGTAVLAATGTTSCFFDAAGGTVGHFVTASTTVANTCHDAGASFPNTGWVIGQELDSPAANAQGLIAILSGDNGTSAGGSGVTSINFTTPVSGFTFASSTGFPINTANPTGVITLGFSNESAGLAFIGPCTGAAATPTWRALCYNDVPGAVNTVTFSATPNFDLSLGSVQTITMTNNVTSSTITNGSAGKHYSFIICGNFTFVWPAGFHGVTTVNNPGSTCTNQDFDALNATTLYASAPGVNGQ